MMKRGHLTMGYAFLGTSNITHSMLVYRARPLLAFVLHAGWRGLEKVTFRMQLIRMWKYTMVRRGMKQDKPKPLALVTDDPQNTEVVY